MATCPHCCSDVADEATTCAPCGATRKKPGDEKWISARAGARDDLLRAGLSLVIVLWITGAGLAWILTAALWKPAPATKIGTCPVSDVRWPSC